MPRGKEASLSILSMLIILAAIMVSTLTDFAKFGIAQGQANDTSSSSSLSLTPEQKDTICNPDNPESKLNPVNTTESKICGIPKTINSTSSTTPNDTTTGAEEAPPSPLDTSMAPSAVP
jgi:hypothetical protein